MFITDRKWHLRPYKVYILLIGITRRIDLVMSVSQSYKAIDI